MVIFCGRPIFSLKISLKRQNEYIQLYVNTLSKLWQQIWRIVFFQACSKTVSSVYVWGHCVWGHCVWVAVTITHCWVIVYQTYWPLFGQTHFPKKSHRQNVSFRFRHIASKYVWESQYVWLRKKLNFHVIWYLHRYWENKIAKKWIKKIIPKFHYQNQYFVELLLNQMEISNVPISQVLACSNVYHSSSREFINTSWCVLFQYVAYESEWIRLRIAWVCTPK